MNSKGFDPPSAARLYVSYEIIDAANDLHDTENKNSPVALVLVEAISILINDKTTKSSLPSTVFELVSELKNQIVLMNGSISKSRALLQVAIERGGAKNSIGSRRRPT